MKDYQVVLKTELKGLHSIELYIKAYSVEQIVDQLGDDYYIVEIEEWKIDRERTVRYAERSSQGQAS